METDYCLLGLKKEIQKVSCEKLRPQKLWFTYLRDLLWKWQEAGRLQGLWAMVCGLPSWLWFSQTTFFYSWEWFCQNVNKLHPFGIGGLIWIWIFSFSRENTNFMLGRWKPRGLCSGKQTRKWPAGLTIQHRDLHVIIYYSIEYLTLFSENI